MTDCTHCGEPVENGEWHRSCFLAVLGAALARARNGGIAR